MLISLRVLLYVDCTIPVHMFIASMPALATAAVILRAVANLSELARIPND